jgi:hypothetical protein
VSYRFTQISCEMLPRRPLRFLLADDPGAGRTIMDGLLIEKLIVRGDVERCLIVPLGSLVPLRTKIGPELDISPLEADGA